LKILRARWNRCKRERAMVVATADVAME